MDMRISGSGIIPEGEYNNISVSGCGRLYGQLRCASFRASGSSKGENIECSAVFKISGSSSFAGTIKAKEIRIAGSVAVGEDIISDSISVSGSLKCNGNLKCNELFLAGSLAVAGNVEAENAKIYGISSCSELIASESIELQSDRQINIGSIHGKIIKIKRKAISIFIKRRVTVASSIVGDELNLEYVTCPCVKGRKINIGKGCKIDNIEYSESLNISRGAKVGKANKILTFS